MPSFFNTHVFGFVSSGQIIAGSILNFKLNHANVTVCHATGILALRLVYTTTIRRASWHRKVMTLSYRVKRVVTY